MNRNFAYIKFTGAEDVSVITDVLNLEPSKAWNIGEKRSNGSIYGFSSWSYENIKFENELLDEAISEVVSFIEANKIGFSMVPHCFELTIQCVGYHEESISGFHLSRELIKRLYNVGAAVDFDLYCHKEG
jgi:hypothetical protein